MQTTGYTVKGLLSALGILVGVLSHVGIVAAHHTPEHQGDQAVTPLVVGGIFGTAVVGAVIAATTGPKARWHRQFHRTNRDRIHAGLPPLDYCTTLREHNTAWTARSKQCR